jgi:hypothetical protein
MFSLNVRSKWSSSPIPYFSSEESAKATETITGGVVSNWPVTVNFASEFDATTRSAALSRLAAGMVIAIAALTADVGVPANTKVTEVPPTETASFAVIVIPEGALVTHPERSALMEMGLKVSSVRVITASWDVIAVPVVPDTSTLAIAASGFALALDNPDTPIARERRPVIKNLESLFSLEGFEREMSMLVI